MKSPLSVPGLVVILLVLGVVGTVLALPVVEAHAHSPSGDRSAVNNHASTLELNESAEGGFEPPPTPSDLYVPPELYLDLWGATHPSMNSTEILLDAGYELEDAQGIGPRLTSGARKTFQHDTTHLGRWHRGSHDNTQGPSQVLPERSDDKAVIVHENEAPSSAALIQDAELTIGYFTPTAVVPDESGRPKLLAGDRLDLGGTLDYRVSEWDPTVVDHKRITYTEQYTYVEEFDLEYQGTEPADQTEHAISEDTISWEGTIWLSDAYTEGFVDVEATITTEGTAYLEECGAALSEEERQEVREELEEEYDDEHVIEQEYRHETEPYHECECPPDAEYPCDWDDGGTKIVSESVEVSAAQTIESGTAEPVTVDYYPPQNPDETRGVMEIDLPEYWTYLTVEDGMEFYSYQEGIPLRYQRFDEADIRYNDEEIEEGVTLDYTPLFMTWVATSTADTRNNLIGPVGGFNVLDSETTPRRTGGNLFDRHETIGPPDGPDDRRYSALDTITIAVDVPEGAQGGEAPVPEEDIPELAIASVVGGQEFDIEYRQQTVTMYPELNLSAPPDDEYYYIELTEPDGTPIETEGDDQMAIDVDLPSGEVRTVQTDESGQARIPVDEPGQAVAIFRADFPLPEDEPPTDIAYTEGPDHAIYLVFLDLSHLLLRLVFVIAPIAFGMWIGYYALTGEHIFKYLLR